MGSGLPGTLKALERIGYVQIDTISVVERAHNHTLWIRASNYHKNHLNRLIARREAFEYWYHAASYLPMRDFRFSLPMKNARRTGQKHSARTKKLLRYVLDRVTEEGPLTSRDFETPEERRGKSQGWWDWKPTKVALETLYMQGDLMVSGRTGFTKRYDLPERLLPAGIRTDEPTTDELAAHLIEITLAAHGYAEVPVMRHLRRGAALRHAMQAQLDARIADRSLVRFELDGRMQYAEPATLEAIKKPAPVVRILSPFDNSVIHRSRGQTIFEFDYVLECYVPEPRRRWGYFCLPLLYGDTFVGRMDCKAHRRGSATDGIFEIKQLYVDRPTDAEFDAAFIEATREYAAFTGCSEIRITSASPARFKSLFR